MLEVLKQTLRDAPVVKFGDYDYFVYPISDGIPTVSPRLLQDITDGMASIANLDCDKIVTPEAMGIHLATALSLKTGIPFTIIRKKKYNLEGEVAFEQETGYSSGKMYINGVESGDRVVLVDDILSTGGTIRGILKALDNLGVEVVDVVIAIDKGQSRKAIEEEFGIKIKCLVSVEIADGKVVIKDP
jgi:adenine phosphoribosyltransferase